MLIKLFTTPVYSIRTLYRQQFAFRHDLDEMDVRENEAYSPVDLHKVRIANLRGFQVVVAT